jgi:hypothetical protein
MQPEVALANLADPADHRLTLALVRGPIEAADYQRFHQSREALLFRQPIQFRRPNTLTPQAQPS